MWINVSPNQCCLIIKLLENSQKIIIIKLKNYVHMCHKQWSKSPLSTFKPPFVDQMIKPLINGKLATTNFMVAMSKWMCKS
jgi:hypothetical protein